MEEVVSDGEVAEVDGGPCGPGRAAGDGEDEEPCEEEEQDVGGPDPGVDEPLGILVQVHRRRRLHVVGRTSPPHPRPYPAAGSSDLGVSSGEVAVAGAGGRQRTGGRDIGPVPGLIGNCLETG